MANSKSSSNVRNFMHPAKHALLPPKSPFPSVSSSYVDHVPSGVIGSKAIPKPRDGNAVHQRTSSETFHIEEQPSWLDDLLNEPETPVRRGGHRRSSSDSFAYVDVANTSNLDYGAKDDYYRVRSPIGTPSWGPQNFDYLGNAHKTMPYSEVIANLTNQKHRAWDSMNAPSLSGGLPSSRENVTPQCSKTSNVVSEADTLKSSSSEKQDTVESEQVDSKTSSESKDGSHAKASTSEADTKRAKQQFAQRSRVRKLQYIAELERNVQALQAEGSGVSAELEFLNHRNIILNMENKALKQRLESLTQEQLIKYYEHEILEKEKARLRALYKQQQEQLLQTQQQQQQQKPSSSHRRNNSRDLDSQFANLSLKHKDSNTSHDPSNGPFRT